MPINTPVVGYEMHRFGWRQFGRLVVNYGHNVVRSVYLDGVCLYQSADDVRTWGVRVQ